MDLVSEELKAIVKRLNKDMPEFHVLARDCPYSKHITDHCDHEENPTVMCEWDDCPLA